MRKRLQKKLHTEIWAEYKKIASGHRQPTRRLKALLKVATKMNPPLMDYNYHGDWYGHFEYVSDRMNSGRAKAILRLISGVPCL